MTPFDVNLTVALPEEDQPSSQAPKAVDDPRVVQQLEQYIISLEQGESPDRQSLLNQYPPIAKELAACLESIELVHQVNVQLSGEGARGIGEKAGADRSRQPSMLGDFQIKREIGRGGMGVVYEAEQVSLGRQVALKMLPFAAMLNQKQLQRFQNEARAAALLDHPNIVSVHCVGCERGVHFYAMQFVQGRTLAEVIGELRELSSRPQAERKARDDKSPPGELFDMGSGRDGTPRHIGQEPTADWQKESAAGAGQRRHGSDACAISDSSTQSERFFHAVADIGVQVADALEHAHQMGVVHRDIKPSNLLIDGHGRVRITDFGLAITRTNVNLTMTGDLVGTARYMSPEQVAAKRDVLDHRTDIYSLGVTLYELMTLHPAFEEEDRHLLLRQITDKDPPWPHQWNRAVPSDLETVVLKAMAKDPKDRYSTAQDLGDDLRNFMEGKPIKARRPTLADRLLKWSRRHVLLLCLSLALLAVALLATGAGSLLIWSERQRTERARGHAEANFQRAMGAVNHMLSWVGQETMKNMPHMEKARQGLLRDALKFYEDFLHENSEDPGLRFETGRAYLRMAEIHRLLAEHERAENAYRQGIAILEGLLAEAPDALVCRQVLGRAHAGLGLLWESIGRLTEAEEACRQAIRVYEGMPSYFPAGVAKSSLLSEAYVNLAHLLADQGLVDEAKEHYERAIHIQEQLADAVPPRTSDRQILAQSHNGLGNLQFSQGQIPDAETAYRASLAIREELVARHPEEVQLLEELAISLNNLGAACWRQSRDEEAKDLLERAVEIATTLSRDFSSLPDYHWELAVATGNLALAWKALGKREEAQAAHLEAVDLLRRLVDEFPERKVFGQHLLTLRSNLGDHPSLSDLAEQSGDGQCEAGAINAASPAKRRNIPSQPKDDGDLAVVLRKPSRVTFWRDADFCWQVMPASTEDPKMQNDLARVLATSPHDATRDPERAVALAAQAVRFAPEEGVYWSTLGIAQYQLGDLRAAAGALQKSVELGDEDGLTQLYLAMALWQLGQEDEASACYARACSSLDAKDLDAPGTRTIAAEAAEIFGKGATNATKSSSGP